MELMSHVLVQLDQESREHLGVFLRGAPAHTRLREANPSDRLATVEQDAWGGQGGHAAEQKAERVMRALRIVSLHNIGIWGGHLLGGGEFARGSRQYPRLDADHAILFR